MNAKLLKCDGEIVDITLRTGDLRQMCELMGCTMLECHKVAQGYDVEIDLWVDEDGWMKENPLPNPVASEIFSRYTLHKVEIVGDCILVGSIFDEETEEARIADLPLIYCDWIADVARTIRNTNQPDLT